MSSASVQIRKLTLTLALAVLGLLLVTGPSTASPDATTSIINGSPTTITQWPWQVAIASSKAKMPGSSPWYRTFCGGSIVAPTIVLTAGHCALELLQGGPSRYSVISGRTNLNAEATGQEVRVLKVQVPRTGGGAPRYPAQAGWDVALIELRSPLAGTPIRLLGPDEGIAGPGMRLIETGWGTTITGSNYSPKSLKVGGTNIQPGGICRSRIGARYFRDSLQICLGDANGYQANCYGDSGGPAVVATTDGYRQVGVTSSGTANDCSGTIANVDVLVGGTTVRNWIQSSVQNLAGVDPVGSGGSTSEPGTFCRIPSVRGLTFAQAKSKITGNGCLEVRLKRSGRGNLVRKNPAPAGWLWNRGTPIRLLVGG